MKSILEELFYGNVCPNTDCRSKDKEVKDLMAHIADHHSSLNETLTEKQILLSTIQRKIGGSIEPPIFFYFLANPREISRFRNKHNGLLLPCFEG